MRVRETSLAALKAIKDWDVVAQNKVCAYIELNPYCTDEECQLDLGMNGNSQRPARVALEKKRFIRAFDEEGINKSGRKATRWVVTYSR